MGRRRKDPGDNKLPPRVSKTKTRYYYKPTSRETVTLGPITLTMSALWKRYEEERRNYSDVMTFEKLWGMFLKSAYYTELAIRTQRDYLQHQKKLLAVFGKVKADVIKPEDVRQFMDRRGLQSKNQANQEMSSMSRVYRWGYERGYVKGNPCAGVSKFSLKAREQYITDEDYLAIYKHADHVVRAAMEISYLCAARQADVLELRWMQISDKGIFIQQGKTGKKQIKVWTPRLREALETAQAACPKLSPDALVLYNSDRGQFIRKTFNNRWLKAVRAAQSELNRQLDYTFHDIKAKAISDFEGSSRDKQIFSGHKTESQVLIYDRKVQISPTLDRPLIGKK
ncbi:MULTISPECIES: tyrosine-type recombinase/integrase [Citrobacter]|uniref:tyrosine-type recombinase/integrase n=1 Tax=Citrobacter TaxID=544 RepID=UPI00157625D5|nr:MULTISPECIES: tyrosine-type recombinase/integrase [Citrobacter]MDM7200310.1 tyrosine-type recombinase/integrase [Citrobacter freundii]NTY83130.1 tyrosine-type recombinase/integrase [Citrobacter werkmanii]QLW41874.1 tyrosine-type recombinase/integrase [Citrobacter sp. RHBSTW-00524]HAT2340379.1 tyrosine-type recombinase/integrase [Citrobacter freundii]HAT2362867.1 tyrosine-type recombinase/integrase [Citrobacter freundii]